MNETEIEQAEYVAAQYPILKVLQAQFKVLGVEAVIPSAIVTLFVRCKLITPEVLSEDDGKFSDDVIDEEEEVKAWYNSTEEVYAHAPYYPIDKKPTWWIILADPKNKRIITVTKLSSLSTEQTARLQFQAPENPGNWNFQVFIKSDSYVGCDKSIPLQVITIMLVGCRKPRIDRFG